MIGGTTRGQRLEEGLTFEPQWLITGKGHLLTVPLDRHRLPLLQLHTLIIQHEALGHIVKTGHLP